MEIIEGYFSITQSSVLLLFFESMQGKKKLSFNFLEISMYELHIMLNFEKIAT